MSQVIGGVIVFTCGFCFGVCREKWRRLVEVARAREEFDQLMLHITQPHPAISPVGEVDYSDPDTWGRA